LALGIDSPSRIRIRGSPMRALATTSEREVRIWTTRARTRTVTQATTPPIRVGVRADHRVLGAVGHDQQDDQVRGRELADLALAADPQGDHEEGEDGAPIGS